MAKRSQDDLTEAKRIAARLLQMPPDPRKGQGAAQKKEAAHLGVCSGTVLGDRALSEDEISELYAAGAAS